MANPSVWAGRLVQILTQETTPVWPVYAVTAGRRVPQRVRQLMAHVRRTLGEALND
jgi:hypothetical protein